MSRRTTTIDIGTAGFVGDHLVLDSAEYEGGTRVRIVADDTNMEYLAERCIEYFRKRRDRASDAIKRLATECAR